MRSSADNVAVGNAGREKGQRLSIFGGNVIAGPGNDSATQSTKPCFNTVTALEAFPHSSLPQDNVRGQEVATEGCAASRAEALADGGQGK
jgi:hypothetical protein